MDSDKLSNHLASATMAGFWIASQRELTRPYVDRYFAEIAGIWTSRTFDTAATITQMLFPDGIIEQSTLDKVDAYLAGGNPTPPLRRALAEGRDGLVRALAARAKDAEAARG
jgi:aminopeptidase N